MKRIKAVLLIVITILQVLLVEYNFAQFKASEIGMKTQEILDFIYLKDEGIITKDNKLIEYKDMNAEQARNIRNYTEDKHSLTKEKKEIFINTYKEMDEAEKIIINYSLYANDKEPVETVNKLNSRLMYYNKILGDMFEYKELFKNNLGDMPLLTIGVLFTCISYFILTYLYDSYDFSFMLKMTETRKIYELRRTFVAFVFILIQNILLMKLPINNAHMLTIPFLVLNLILYEFMVPERKKVDLFNKTETIRI